MKHILLKSGKYLKNNEVRKKILPFVTTYNLALSNLKNIASFAALFAQAGM